MGEEDPLTAVEYFVLEYNITAPSIEKTGRKPCSIREHIIGIVMVSECDFDNVTAYEVVMFMHVRASLKRDLRLKH